MKNVRELNKVKEEYSRTYLVARSFLDQSLFVGEECSIPAGSPATASGAAA